MTGPVDRVSEVPLFRLVKSAASAFRISTDELWLVVLDALATGELSACIARVFEGEAGERRWMDLLSGARYAVAQSGADPARWPWVRAIKVDAADWEIWLAANFPRKRKVPASTMPRQRASDAAVVTVLGRYILDEAARGRCISAKRAWAWVKGELALATRDQTVICLRQLRGGPAALGRPRKGLR